MAEYDYGNARIRAMKSRLLTDEQLLVLAESQTIDLLLTQLSQTPYQRAMETAILRTAGMERIHLLTQLHLVETIAKIRGFYEGVAFELIRVMLLRYDIHNLKTILRGLDQYVPHEKIRSALLPIGELSSPILTQLTQTGQINIAIDMLASLQFSTARPLIELRSQTSSASVAQMEASLEQWYFRYAKQTLTDLKQLDTPLFKALKIEEDIINLLISFRFIHLSLETKDIVQWFVSAGYIPRPLLVQIAQSETIAQALNLLQKTKYHSALAEGLKRYERVKHLSEFERVLHHYRNRILIRYMAQDSLGVGVPLGYLTLQENEIRNIRAIAWGIQLRQSANQIKDDLELVV